VDRGEDRRKSSAKPEAETLARYKDQGVETHEQREEGEEGKEAEGSEEGKRLQEERARGN
jgi:hypothetical protein